MMPNFDDIGLPVPEKILRAFTIYGMAANLVM